MKKLYVPFLSWLLIAGLSGCNGETRVSETAGIREESSSSVNIKPQESKMVTNTGRQNVLIAYFSMPENVDTSRNDAVAGASIVVKGEDIMGNTEYVAKLIQQTVGGDLFRIETEEIYPTDHEALVDQAAGEQNRNDRPALSTHIENMEQYEIILLGFPNWWGDLPMPVYTFLEEYDLGAKTIIPFVTHGGSGFSSTVKTITRLQPGATVRDEGISLSRNSIANSADAVITWAENLGLNEAEALPQSDTANTVANVTVDPNIQQSIYLWEEGNVPAVTEYTVNNGNYSDDPDFRPYLTSYPVPEGIEVKGAVLICSGGAFIFRGNQNEGTPVAQELSQLGYQCFVVDYRLSPYTQQEGALDLARAVRFVRIHADEYGIDSQDIAVMGFSAGGILAGEMLLNFDGFVNGTALDPKYIPDELDLVSADADGMIYSFYGRLSFASDDVEKFAASALPPTYFCYGTLDPFVDQFEKNIAALQQADIAVESVVLQDTPHGYGNRGGWIPAYGDWLNTIFENN